MSEISCHEEILLCQRTKPVTPRLQTWCSFDWTNFVMWSENIKLLSEWYHCHIILGKTMKLDLSFLLFLVNILYTICRVMVTFLVSGVWYDLIGNILVHTGNDTWHHFLWTIRYRNPLWWKIHRKILRQRIFHKVYINK